MAPGNRSPFHDGILEEIERAGPFASIDELNRRLATYAAAYNNRITPLFSRFMRFRLSDE